MCVIVIKPGQARLLIWNFGSVEETRAAVGGEVDIGQYSTVLGRSARACWTGGCFSARSSLRQPEDWGLRRRWEQYGGLTTRPASPRAVFADAVAVIDTAQYNTVWTKPLGVLDADGLPGEWKGE